MRYRLVWLASLLYSSHGFVLQHNKKNIFETSRIVDEQQRLLLTATSKCSTRPKSPHWRTTTSCCSTCRRYENRRQPRHALFSSSSDDDTTAGSDADDDTSSFSLRRLGSGILSVATLLLFYIFHLTVLSQHVFILAGVLPIGYDSLVGTAVAFWYLLFRIRKQQRDKKKKNDDHLQALPWKLPMDPKTLPNIRCRVTTFVTIVLLVMAYFQTGRFSLFWEDMLFGMSYSGWQLTIPLSRSLQVLLGHLTWVAAGSTILWLVPRPPAFFGKGHPRMFQWFQSSSRKVHWLWWTIGGYFVSSWLFNLADTLNRIVLPAQVLQNAAESVVTQLVQPEQNDVLASLVGYVAPCISAPVWEEVLYRGFLLPGLTLMTGSFPIAALLQAIVFSAHHMSTTAALPLAVLGGTWAVLYQQSRNLLTVIIVHAMWNSRVFIGSWFGL